MADSVFDATVIGMANGDIATKRPGTVLDRRLRAIEQAATGIRRIRYNSKLLQEFVQLVKVRRNDVVELFFIALDSDRAVRVKRNTLSRCHHATAKDKCGWPSHDQHLLAAAVGGTNPIIFVTEDRHAVCGAQVLRLFGIHIDQLTQAKA